MELIVCIRFSPHNSGSLWLQVKRTARTAKWRARVDIILNRYALVADPHIMFPIKAFQEDHFQVNESK